MTTAYFNPWGWWQAKLAGKAVEMNPSNPHAGFYRQPHKEFYGARRTFKPVAYWPGKNGKLNCRIGDVDVTPEVGEQIWERVGNNPVSEQAYRAVAENGEPWPDEHDLVPMGDNLPPPDNSFEGLRDAIEPLSKEAEERIKGPAIENQDEADRFGNLADRLSELWKLADKQRKEERRPHDEAITEIQKKWAPLLVMAETYKNLKYRILTPWLKRQEEAQKKEAEAAAAAGEPAAAEARRPRVGTRGRAMTLKSTKKAQINDYAVCLKFFEDSEDVKGTVQMLANRAVRAGITVPGVTVIEEEKAV
jgi:hypothetical protein